MVHGNFDANFLFRGNVYFKKCEKCLGGRGVINSVEGGGGGGGGSCTVEGGGVM